MKNKEEPLANSQRGNPSGQVDLYRPGGVGSETTGSLPRPGSTAAAQVEKPALSLNPMSLMEAVVDEANLETAWKNVKANRGAPGPDGVTITEFPEWFRPRWAEIRQQLLDGTYRPGPVRRKTIDKPDGGQRLLGIPNVLDRLIQQAIVQVLTPIFDPHFSESSFGFRPKRSAHGAAKQVQRIIRRGHRFAADIDLSKFFDRVQHDVLMTRVARRVDDRLLLRLIGCYLRAGVMVEGVLQSTDVGTPQGGPLSPILSNILLDDLDKELERRGLPLVRYADDFAVFAKSLRAAQRIMASVCRYLTGTLRLVVNHQKSRVVASEEFEFLGFAFVKSRATINVATKSIRKFKHRIREITGRSRGISMERRLSELRSYLRGWMGYFGLASQLKLFDKLDQWIRRRIRMCYWLAVAPAETSARNAHSSRRTAPPSHPPRTQPPKLLAHVQDNCQWRRADQRVACRAGTVKHEDLLGQACSATSNRPVLTSMLWWCGEGHR